MKRHYPNMPGKAHILPHPGTPAPKPVPQPPRTDVLILKAYPARWHRYDGDHDCWSAGCDLVGRL